MESKNIDFVIEDLLNKAYECFNNRDIDCVLFIMDKDVDWANGMEGGIEHGHEAVREYWIRQWEIINPHVEPIGFNVLKDGRVNVIVHQVVKDMDGNLLSDDILDHVYTFENALIKSMEIVKRQEDI